MRRCVDQQFSSYQDRDGALRAVPAIGAVPGCARCRDKREYAMRPRSPGNWFGNQPSRRSCGPSAIRIASWPARFQRLDGIPPAPGRRPPDRVYRISFRVCSARALLRHGPRAPPCYEKCQALCFFSFLIFLCALSEALGISQLNSRPDRR